MCALAPHAYHARTHLDVPVDDAFGMALADKAQDAAGEARNVLLAVLPRGNSLKQGAPLTQVHDQVHGPRILKHLLHVCMHVYAHVNACVLAVRVRVARVILHTGP